MDPYTASDSYAEMMSKIQSAVAALILLPSCVALMLIIRRAVGALKLRFATVVKLQHLVQKRLLLAGIVFCVWYFLFFSLDFTLLGETGNLQAGAPFRVRLEKIFAVVAFPMDCFPMWEPGGSGWLGHILAPISQLCFWMEILVSGSFWAFVLISAFHLAALLFARLRQRKQMRIAPLE